MEVCKCWRAISLASITKLWQDVYSYHVLSNYLKGYESNQVLNFQYPELFDTQIKFCKLIQLYQFQVKLFTY